MTVAFWPPRPRDDYYRWYPPYWTAAALCAQVDPEMFYPEKGTPAAPARMICAACPVRAQCLDDALARGEPWGIWGGMTERERRALRKTRRTAA